MFIFVLFVCFLLFHIFVLTTCVLCHDGNKGYTCTYSLPYLLIYFVNRISTNNYFILNSMHVVEDMAVFSVFFLLNFHLKLVYYCFFVAATICILQKKTKAYNYLLTSMGIADSSRPDCQTVIRMIKPHTFLFKCRCPIGL